MEQSAALDEEMSKPDFWNDKDNAQKKTAEVSSLKARIEPFRKLADRVEDFDVLVELAKDEGDAQSAEEVRSEYDAIGSALDELELMLLLDGEFDKNNAYLRINAGAGGTESCDWANMLLRMYQRYAERHGFGVQLLDISEAVTRAALERTESRGAHTREDHPGSEPEWGKVNVIVRQTGEEIGVVREPLAEIPPNLKQLLEGE